MLRLGFPCFYCILNKLYGGDLLPRYVTSSKITLNFNQDPSENTVFNLCVVFPLQSCIYLSDCYSFSFLLYFFTGGVLKI
jgi:hypothetical protein